MYELHSQSNFTFCDIQNPELWTPHDIYGNVEEMDPKIQEQVVRIISSSHNVFY